MAEEPEETVTRQRRTRTAGLVLAVLLVGPPVAAQQAHQSSTYGQASAQRAFDGVADGELTHGSVAMTHRDPYAYWWVDLGAARPIAAVTVHGRTDESPERLDGFVLVAIPEGPAPGSDPLLVTLDRRQLTVPGFVREGWTIHRSQHRFTAESARETVPLGGTYRYVYIVLPRADYLQLAEVEIQASY